MYIDPSPYNFMLYENTILIFLDDDYDKLFFDYLIDLTMIWINWLYIA